jgi:hypothetical protein
MIPCGATLIRSFRLTIPTVPPLDWAQVQLRMLAAALKAVDQEGLTAARVPVAMSQLRPVPDPIRPTPVMPRMCQRIKCWLRRLQAVVMLER